MADVLIAYASKYGSNRLIAERVAERLREERIDVEVATAESVQDLSRHHAVVLGGGLYAGRWHRDARLFLRRHARTLEDLPVAVWASGPKTTAPDEAAESRAQLDRGLAKAPDVDVRTVAVFGGVVDPTVLHFPLNRLPASDARDWDAIDEWARSLPAALELALPRVPVRA